MNSNEKHGNQWKSMEINGINEIQWQSTGIHLFSVVSNANQWIFIGFDVQWKSIDFNRKPWISMGIHGFS